MFKKTISVLVFLMTYKGCSGSTVVYEKGSRICLPFTITNSTILFIIRKDSFSLCIYLNGNSVKFDSNWRNGTYSCSVSDNKMSVCFEDGKSEDAGVFSLYNGTTDKSTGIEDTTLKITTPVTSVTISPTLITLNAGEEMNITCTTSFCNPQANVTWYMSSTDMNTRQYIFSTEEKNADLIRTKSTLQRIFSAVDDGKWVYCSASNIPGRSVNSTSQKVTVRYKPEVTSSTPGQFIVIQGQNASLECTVAAANPNTNIKWRWFRTDSPSDTLYNESTYTIFGIKRDKAGSYSCTARNSVGTSKAVTMTIDVQYKPEVTSTNPGVCSVTEGLNATLKCEMTAANPNTSITWRWFRTDSPHDTLYNESTYTIFGIKRDKAGSYSCTARNSVGTSKAVTMIIDVQYIPEVTLITPSHYSVIEEHNATLECAVRTANPNTNITWRWFRTASSSDTLHYGPAFNILNILRDKSGMYNCTARNSVGTSIAGSIVVDVQYRPEIVEKSSTIANESDRVVLTREIVSNPMSNVSWFNGSKLLETQTSVKNATLVINKALCTDTRNFTIVASNTVERYVTSSVELIVNCKPRSYKTNISLGVTDTTGIEFSTTVIAYPEPQYKLYHENGTINKQMRTKITRNTINNFTIHFNQSVVDQSSFGLYHLNISNFIGSILLFVNVLPQRKPNRPEKVSIVCDIRRARVLWKSSFNGGDPQLFTVIELNGQKSDTVPDKGENEIHSIYVQNLQPSTAYVFYVSAKNSHGSSYSENVNCTTFEESSDNLPLIAGSAAASGITLGIIIIIVVILSRRYIKHEQHAGKSQRFENDSAANDNAEDDGLRENILYVSADVREDKPEAAVYAAVNKKESESNSNANIYAEVKKSDLKCGGKKKRGFLEKKEQPKKGERTKQNKGKKQKCKQEVADVYENSEDIPMKVNVDNVYSNTEDNEQSKNERGYKNKDGLLYVEVNFDGKQGQDNPVIHGEDEKTDYATVEFPMPSSVHKASGGEEL